MSARPASSSSSASVDAPGRADLELDALGLVVAALGREVEAGVHRVRLEVEQQRRLGARPVLAGGRAAAGDGEGEEDGEGGAHGDRRLEERREQSPHCRRQEGMPRIVVLGGGVCGLAAGLMLARDGHDVTRARARPGAGARDARGRVGGMGARRRRRSSTRRTACSRAAARCSTPSCRTSATRSPPRARTRFDALDSHAAGDRGPRAAAGDERFVTLTRAATGDRARRRARGRGAARADRPSRRAAFAACSRAA